MKIILSLGGKVWAVSVLEGPWVGHWERTCESLSFFAAGIVALVGGWGWQVEAGRKHDWVWRFLFERRAPLTEHLPMGCAKRPLQTSLLLQLSISVGVGEGQHCG